VFARLARRRKLEKRNKNKTMGFFDKLFKKKKIETIKHSDVQLENYRKERLIFDGKFTLVTEETDFRMALWIRGFGLTNTSTKEEILPVMHSFNLDHFEENGNILSVKFRIYPNGSKDYEVEINPFEKTFMYNTTKYNLSDFENYFYELARI